MDNEKQNSHVIAYWTVRGRALVLAASQDDELAIELKARGWHADAAAVSRRAQRRRECATWLLKRS